MMAGSGTADFIRQSMRLEPVPALDDIRLYTAHSGSRLSRLQDRVGGDVAPPYWAYQWAGGLALAHHFRTNAMIVKDRRLLDLGAGSGLAGIVAAKLGANVSAAEIDPIGQLAIGLNAAANSVKINIVDADLTKVPLSDFDIIAAGDVFYNPDVAALMLPFLLHCHTAGAEVLIGDPDRRDLPIDQLQKIASYAVSDVGDIRHAAARVGSIYRLMA